MGPLRSLISNIRRRVNGHNTADPAENEDVGEGEQDQPTRPCHRGGGVTKRRPKAPTPTAAAAHQFVYDASNVPSSTSGCQHGRLVTDTGECVPCPHPRCYQITSPHLEQMMRLVQSFPMAYCLGDTHKTIKQKKKKQRRTSRFYDTVLSPVPPSFQQQEYMIHDAAATVEDRDEDEDDDEDEPAAAADVGDVDRGTTTPDTTNQRVFEECKITSNPQSSVPPGAEKQQLQQQRIMLNYPITVSQDEFNKYNLQTHIVTLSPGTCFWLTKMSGLQKEDVGFELNPDVRKCWLEEFYKAMSAVTGESDDEQGRTNELIHTCRQSGIQMPHDSLVSVVAIYNMLTDVGWKSVSIQPCSAERSIQLTFRYIFNAWTEQQHYMNPAIFYCIKEENTGRGFRARIYLNKNNEHKVYMVLTVPHCTVRGGANNTNMMSPASGSESSPSPYWQYPHYTDP